MPLIPYNFIPISKNEKFIKSCSRARKSRFYQNNPVLIQSYYDGNKFKRIYSDG